MTHTPQENRPGGAPPQQNHPPHTAVYPHICHNNPPRGTLAHVKTVSPALPPTKPPHLGNNAGFLVGCRGVGALEC